MKSYGHSDADCDLQCLFPLVHSSSSSSSSPIISTATALVPLLHLTTTTTTTNYTTTATTTAGDDGGGIGGSDNDGDHEGCKAEGDEARGDGQVQVVRPLLTRARTLSQGLVNYSVSSLQHELRQLIR